MRNLTDTRECNDMLKDVLLRVTRTPHVRFAHIVNRSASSCVVGKSVNDALARNVGTADKLEGLYIRRLLNQDSQSGYIRIEHAASDGETDEFGYDVRVPLDDLSDENSSREADEPDYHICMPINDVSDRDGYWPTLRPTSTRA